MAAKPPPDAAAPNPAALTPAQLAQVLAAARGKTTVEHIEQDLVDGAPHNPDGTIHLVHYTAWLASQVK